MKGFAGGTLLAVAAMCAAGLHAQTTTPVMVGGGVAGAGKVTKSAQRPQGINSPVPVGLTTAHKLFVSNAGADAGLFPHPFTGTQDRAYGQFYKLVEANGSFQIVDTPAEADLVLQIALTAPSGAIGGDKKHGTEDPLPAFKLTIYDRATHYILWTMSQTVDQANLQKTHDKNFDDALILLGTQMFTLLGSGK